ncbi:DNRLRE domain-containing protein [Bacillus horti]|uniref:Carbohydrate-binding module family 96 domain-containing protein n=1 Tax=Caldalkalibacillus horti TaxID=77523 RepID=A0ABT9VZ41_9BACI|nr:DNRLRE domain-containing protein [Bacillus horti]MDQ0166130.1 hypothetical protein [Bacillus horti]
MSEENKSLILWTSRFQVEHGCSKKNQEECSPSNQNHSANSTYFVEPATTTKYNLHHKPIVPKNKTFIQNSKVPRENELHTTTPSNEVIYNRMEGEVDVYGVGESIIKGTIVVRIHNDIRGRIKLSPRNRMFGLLDVQPIPRVEEILTPTKDAFFRSGVIRINYGKEHAMAVGVLVDSSYTEDGFEALRSVLQFDLSHLPDNVEIERAVLRLHTLHATEELREKMYEVFLNLRDWSETSVAWVNQPDVSEDSVTGKSIKGSDTLEINVLELVQKWTEEKEPNFGFALRSLEEELQMITQSFFTREYHMPDKRPQLDLRYYDRNLIVSLGRVPLRGNIVVRQHVNGDLRSRIEIRSFFGSNGLSSTITVVNPNYRVGTITISQRKVKGVLYTRQLDDLGITGTITIPGKDFDEQESTIAINRRLLHGMIRVAYETELSAQLQVSNKAYSQIPFTIQVMRKHLLGRVEVRAQKSLYAELKIAREDTWTMAGKLITKHTAPPLSGRMTVVQASFLLSNIVTSRPDMLSRLRVRGISNADLKGIVGILGSEYQTFNGKITIKNRVGLDSEIVIKHRRKLLAKLKVEPVSYLPSIINVVSPYLPSKIAIAGYGSDGLHANIVVNVRMINELTSTILIQNPRNLPCVLVVKGLPTDSGGYAFIM